MLSLLSELTEQFLPGTSENEIRRRNRLKGRSYGILCDHSSGSSSPLGPLDNMNVAAFELRNAGGLEEQARELEELCDRLPESAHGILNLLFTLRTLPRPRRSSEGNSRAYPTYSSKTFIKDLNGALLQGIPSSLSISPTIFQPSLSSQESSSSSLLVPIPPLEITLNADGQRLLRVPRPIRPMALNPPDKEDDQGYTSGGQLPEDENNSFPWDMILSLEAPSSGLRRNWENLSLIDPPKEPPYLSEHAKGVLKAWALGWHNLELSNPQIFAVPALIIRKEVELITDIGYLMMGIASRSFGFKSYLQEFFVVPGLALDNLTPETLASYVEDYVTCGTYFRRLERFVEKKNLLEGLIFQCFQTGVKNYLDGFRAMVLRTVGLKKTLLELSQALKPLCKHVFFLAELCKVVKSSSSSNSSKREELPRGIRLLSHLFDMTYFVNSKDLYFVLISILRITAGPYFRFLERWVFEGICQDDFSEFGLLENGGAASYRDRRYWTHAYVVEKYPEEDSLGGAGFISDIQAQIYQCGKALNFLKLCCADHFLCCTTPESQPRIRLLVSLAEEQRLKKEVREYTEMMSAIVEEKSLSIRAHKLNLEKERKSLAQKARSRHLETLKRIEDRITAEKMKNAEKKRVIREDLQEQVLQDAQRREDLKNRKIKEDKKWIDRALKREEESIKREELARKEIEAHYISLTQAAERREKLAVWKLKRHALRSARIKFWRLENEIHSNVLQNQLNNDESQSVLPNEDSSQTNQNIIKDTWKPLRVQKDDQNNIILEFEDAESNVLNINVDNWSSFSTEDQEHIISTGNVNQLQTWIKDRLLENYSSTTKAPNDNAQPPRRSLDNSATSHAAKKHVSSIVFEEIPSPKKKEKVSSYKVPAKKEVSMIHARKRPKSRHIEDVLHRSSPKTQEIPYARPSPTDFNFNFDFLTQEYTKNYSKFFSEPIGNDFSDRLLSPKREIIDSSNPAATNLQGSSNTVIPLRILMENSILIPLRIQKNLVNQAVLNYILVDAELMSHFEACRNFLLFHDGEFGHKLSFSIFDEFFYSKKSRDLLNPATLNRLVDNAILSCTYGDPRTVQNVGFKRINMNLNEPLEDVLEHLVLTYRISWPYNIILTGEALDKYGELFKFLFQLKKTLWALQQAFQHLKTVGKSFPNSHQLHRLQLMRNEMLNFITVAEGYISTQVLELCWQEFMDDLEHKVKSLDELYEAHEKYLNKALFRCLLNKKAERVQKIISDIFHIITKFSLTLTSKVSSSSPLEPSLFTQLEEHFNLFKEYSLFLYQVVSKLALRGYQHHLYDLMLRLNFSGFYQKLD